MPKEGETTDSVGDGKMASALQHGNLLIPHFGTMRQGTGGVTTGQSAGPMILSQDGRPYETVARQQDLLFGPPRQDFTGDARQMEQRINKVLPDAWYGNTNNRVEELIIQNILSSQQRLLNWCPLRKVGRWQSLVPAAVARLTRLLVPVAHTEPARQHHQMAPHRLQSCDARLYSRAGCGARADAVVRVVDVLDGAHRSGVPDGRRVPHDATG